MSDDVLNCPECGCDKEAEGLYGFEVKEITSEVDRQYEVTRWVQRCWNCGYHWAFIAGPKRGAV